MLYQLSHIRVRFRGFARFPLLRPLATRRTVADPGGDPKTIPLRRHRVGLKVALIWAERLLWFRRAVEPRRWVTIRSCGSAAVIGLGGFGRGHDGAGPRAGLMAGAVIGVDGKELFGDAA